MPAIHASRRNRAIGQLSGAEIASMLTDQQRADIAAKLGVGKAPAAGKAKGSTWSPAIAASPAAKAATQRVLDVMGSQHIAGREKLAVTLLGNRKLEASEIVSMLALAGAQDGAGQDAALADIRATLAEVRALNASAAPAAVVPGRAAEIWERAYAKLESAEFEA